MNPKYLAPALLLLAGCADDGPTSPAFESRVLNLLGGLEVGQALTLRGGDVEELFVSGGAEGADYVLVPFFASETGDARLAVEIEGGNLGTLSAPLNRAPFTPELSVFPERTLPQRDDGFHLRMREWERNQGARILRDPKFKVNRSAVTGRISAQQAVDVPEVGDTIDLRVPNPDAANICVNPRLRPARVGAVTQRAIVAVDLANPPGGFAQAGLEELARRFDEEIYPVNVRNFGEPVDLDNNERVTIFITSVVNELTPPGSQGFTVGFFSPGDIFPSTPESDRFAEVFPGGIPTTALCPSSNEQEIFYILAPDPEGRINQNVRETEEVLQSAAGVIAHEFQHLINAERRVFINNAEDFEEVWLNEGLSHIAEELVFYETTGFEPREDITFDDLTQSREIVEALLRYQVDNLVRYTIYLDDPDAESLLGQDEIPTRGASWAFLRYAADQEEGEDQDFFFALVNSTETGVQNLNRVLSVNAIDLMQTWTISVFTDDAGIRDLPMVLQQPSWNYRDVLSQLFVGFDEFPLAVNRLGNSGSTVLDLQGGGAAFIRFSVEAGARARIGTTSGSNTPPGSLRISLVRTR